MKFEINKARENVLNIAKRIGYIPQHSTENREVVLVRPLERGGYPRFHLYVAEAGDKLVFNLHLDQRRPSYAGSHAHSGEYDGELVHGEAKRIQAII